MGRARLENFVDDMLYRSVVFNTVSEIHHVQAAPDTSRTPADKIEVDEVKHMLDVLFFFIRAGVDASLDVKEADDEFLDAIKFHIKQLVAVLLRRATYSDHQFIVNHLVHCPGCEDWAARFLQFPVLLDEWCVLDFFGLFRKVTNWVFGIRTDIDKKHFLTHLETVLSPVIAKGKFEGQGQRLSYEQLDQLLGNEQGDTSSIFQLSESDLVALFKQFPFARFLSENFQIHPHIEIVRDRSPFYISALTASSALNRLIPPLCSLIPASRRI